MDATVLLATSLRKIVIEKLSCAVVFGRRLFTFVSKPTLIYVQRSHYSIARTGQCNNINKGRLSLIVRVTEALRTRLIPGDLLNAQYTLSITSSLVLTEISPYQKRRATAVPK